MRYWIEYADGRCCNFANSRKDLLDWLKLLKDEKIVDIRKIYKSGVTDSVIDSYRSYMGKEYADWKLSQLSVTEPDEVEEEYKKVIATLPQEQEETITKYCDQIFNSGAETEEFFYRLGLRDGMKLRKTVKMVLKQLSE